MKIQIVVSLCALLLSACTKAPEPSIDNGAAAVDGKMPLRCVECTFVESRRVRRILGKIQNNLKTSLEGIVLGIEFKDSKGTVLARQDNIPLLGGGTIDPGITNQFSITVTHNQPNITQATVYFESDNTHERLSAPTTLLLIVALDS